jgi:hypothetical protein
MRAVSCVAAVSAVGADAVVLKSPNGSIRFVMETAATQETARMTNTVLGACPICGVEMPVVEAGRVQAYVCTEHCVCLPTKDSVPA